MKSIYHGQREKWPNRGVLPSLLLGSPLMTALTAFGDGVWLASAPQRFYGLQFGARMTVIRIGDGTLFLHSPISIDAALKREIDALGQVAHIVAPNLFHHVHAGTAAALYPDAKLHIAPGLDRKRPDLEADALLGATQDPSWRGEIEAVPIEGTILHETAFVHHPTGTLICSDLIENFETSEDWFTRTYLKLNGVHGKPGLSRALRLAFRDKKVARRSIDAVLARPFERISLAHGDPITRGAPEAVRRSYTWLKVPAGHR